METFNKPWLTLLTFAAFIALAWYSKPYETGYTASQRQKMAALVERETQFVAYKPDSQSEVIMDLWNIKQSELTRPVDLFDNRGKRPD